MTTPINLNPLTGTVTDMLNNAWSYAVANCTRFVAGALSWIPPGLGNARDWFANAQKAGLPTVGAGATPPPGSVAVWSTGAFGHVAEVIGALPGGGFQVAEENFSVPGGTDVRNVTGNALQGLEGFILPPGGIKVPSPTDLPGQIGQAVATAGGQAASAAATTVGHGLADAGGAVIHNAGVALRNQLVPLIVALAVVIVLFGGDDRNQSS